MTNDKYKSRAALRACEIRVAPPLTAMSYLKIPRNAFDSPRIIHWENTKTCHLAFAERLCPGKFGERPCLTAKRQYSRRVSQEFRYLRPTATFQHSGRRRRAQRLLTFCQTTDMFVHLRGKLS